MLPFLRTAALRRGSAFVARTARPIARRNFGNEVHAVKSSSEMPWIIGSLAFTIPAVAYLLSGSPSSSDHSGKHSSQRVTHDAHSTVGKAVESAKQSVSDAASKGSQVAESAKEKASEVTSAATTPKSDVKEEVEETAEPAQETTGEAVEQAKQATGETVERAKETTSGMAEAAKEKSSELAEKVKEAPHTLTEKAKATMENIKDKAPGAESSPRTTAESATLEENKKPYTDVTHTGMGAEAAAREAGSFNVQSGKQEGLSNADTWHAELHQGRGKEISKKAEGVHDTAKLKGTVDPKRTGS